MNPFVKGAEYKKEFTVSQAVYDAFQECSNDKNPLHTDEAFATSKGFRGRVVYGNVLNAFLSFFVGECLPTKDVIIHTQEIKYRKPVYLNDVLELYAQIEDVYESVGAIIFKYKFSNQDKVVVANGSIQIGLLS